MPDEKKKEDAGGGEDTRLIKNEKPLSPFQLANVLNGIDERLKALESNKK